MKTVINIIRAGIVLTLTLLTTLGVVWGRDLQEIKAKGVIRHLGVPYANFVTGTGDGMDVELIKSFAKYLGVSYEYVPTSWSSVIGDLTGKKVNHMGDNIEIIGETPVRGDIIANGLTILAWRSKIVDFSVSTFPTQVWLVAGSGLDMKPIIPSDDIVTDIEAVKSRLSGRIILGMANTCLEPGLYDIEAAGAQPKLFSMNLNEMAPAVINGEADATLLDVPDALIALDKWPGKIKVIGPISEAQEMGVAFAKTSPVLRDAFNRFLAASRADGSYLKLVKRYYPAVFDYYPEFFK